MKARHLAGFFVGSEPIPALIGFKSLTSLPLQKYNPRLQNRSLFYVRIFAHAEGG